ncbi:MAG: hypothetical protein U0802_06490 [Candidatus Binatia bacterium]
MKLDRLPAAILEPLRHTAEQRGWRTEVVGAPAESTLFLARDAPALAEVRGLEELLLLGRDDRDTAAAVLRWSALLGYPPCCAARFARVVGQNDSTLAWALLGLPHPPASPLTQWLQPGLALLSHAPCDLGCAASVGWGRACWRRSTRRPRLRAALALAGRPAAGRRSARQSARAGGRRPPGGRCARPRRGRPRRRRRRQRRRDPRPAPRRPPGPPASAAWPSTATTGTRPRRGSPRHREGGAAAARCRLLAERNVC